MSLCPVRYISVFTPSVYVNKYGGGGGHHFRFFYIKTLWLLSLDLLCHPHKGFKKSFFPLFNSNMNQCDFFFCRMNTILLQSVLKIQSVCVFCAKRGKGVMNINLVPDFKPRTHKLYNM
jgi:hypothetical protein